jgi:GNAT superfamily N-acetyltransferase
VSADVTTIEPAGAPATRTAPAAVPALSTRPAHSDDDPLLFEVFASSREAGLRNTAVHPEARQQLLEHEFDSRQRGYRNDFPGVEYLVICAGTEPVGRLYVQRTNRVVFVVDLVLLERWRGRGIGTSLLRDLIDEARTTGRTVRLHVEKSNARAFRLYARLGFTIIGDARTHHLMECRP